jgi:integrase/recombinase XerD
VAAQARRLTEVVEAYLAMRGIAGYALRREGTYLRAFARFMDARGERHVLSKAALRWSAGSRSTWVRVNRIHAIYLFAQYARAEDARHELPPAGYFGKYPKHRPSPYILTRRQIGRILAAAGRLGPSGTLRSEMFQALFALIAATGMRISEALSLRFEDVTADGLVVRRSKSGKGRVLAVHATTTRALRQYVGRRRRVPCETPYLFISTSGRPLTRASAAAVFRKLITDAGIPRQRHIRGPVIHSLRHTFAVRALEACRGDRRAIAEHMRAVSLYLGHSDIVHTYWYYESTPQLMRVIAKQGEDHAREASR